MKKNKKKKMYLILGIVSTLIILLGSSYAFFTYYRSHKAYVLTSEKVGIEAKFQKGTNQITSLYAYPISDDFAISNLNKLTYIDFTVSGSTKVTDPVYYEIYLTEDKNNTLDNKYIKIYITDNKNSKIAGPFTYADLAKTKDQGAKEGRTIISGSNTKFESYYRVYAWISKDYSQNSVSQTFNFYVNLYASNGK